MGRDASRRDILRAVGLAGGSAIVAGALPAGLARAAPTGERATPSGAGDPYAGAAPPVGTVVAAPAAVPTFTTMTVDTKVAARTDRRPVAGGVHDPAVGKTFICWGGKNEDTYAQEYDHAKGTWSKPVKVATGGGDSHNYPTMVLAADGHPLVFVGLHNDQLMICRAPTAHTVAGTWSVKAIADGKAASYPMPFRTANGDLFVFYRETTEQLQSSVPTDTRRMMYVRSTDNGATWKGSRALTGSAYALGSTNRSDHMNEVYIGQLRLEPATAGRPERVHIVWTIAGGGPKQHKHDAYHKDIHYAVFDPATLTFSTVTGASLGTQLDDADYDKVRVLTTSITNPGGLKSPDYIQLVGWQPDGRPFLVWITSDSKALLHNSTAVWTGSAWRIKEVATGYRTRDMEPVNGTTWRVYANREGTPNVETFLLGAEDQSWTAETTIRTAKEIQRLEVITNFADPARVLISGISSARSVSTADGNIYVAGITS